VTLTNVKILIFLMALAVLVGLLGSEPSLGAPAQPDPACLAVTEQAPAVDWSAGTAFLCAPWQRMPDANGAVVTLDTADRMDCFVTNGSTLVTFLDVAPGQKVSGPTPPGVWDQHTIRGQCKIRATEEESEVGPAVAGTFQVRPGLRSPFLLE
jgi:hypothetical protein